MNTRKHKIWLLMLIVMSVLGASVITASVAAQAGHVVEYDEVRTGEITTEIPEKYYRFSASAGDTIIVSMLNKDTNEFYPESHLELLGPDNHRLYTAGNASWQWANPQKLQIGPVTLAETGNYTVILTRAIPQAEDSSGPFELVINRVEVTPLEADETVTAEMEGDLPLVFSYPGGSSDIYRLVANKLEGIGSFSVEVRDPRGQPSPASQDFGAYPDQFVLDAIRMPDEGEYLLVVDREVFYNQQGQPEAASDILELSLTLESVETEPITLDTAINATLSDENPSDYYTFSGSQGDWLRLTGEQTEGERPFWVLVVPPEGPGIIGPGTNWGQNHFVLDPLALTMDGEYVLLVRRTGGTSGGRVAERGELGESDYSITLSASEIPILEPGVETTSTVEGSSIEEFYRYDGVEGQKVQITLRVEGENFWTQIMFESPSEIDLGRTPLMSVYSTLPTTFTFDATLPVTGIYLFHMYNMYGGPAELISGELGLLVEVIE